MINKGEENPSKKSQNNQSKNKSKSIYRNSMKVTGGNKLVDKSNQAKPINVRKSLNIKQRKNSPINMDSNKSDNKKSNLQKKYPIKKASEIIDSQLPVKLPKKAQSQRDVFLSKRKKPQDLKNFQTQPQKISPELAKDLSQFKNKLRKKNQQQNNNIVLNHLQKELIENKSDEKEFQKMNQDDYNEYNLPLKQNHIVPDKQKYKKRNVSQNIKQKKTSLNQASISQTDSIGYESLTLSYFSRNDIFQIIEEIKNVSEQKQWVFDDTETHLKKLGYVEAFVVSTHKGLIRRVNEDRVAITLNGNSNFEKYKNKDNPIKFCNFFSVIDGHGGMDCCNYIKKNLHEKILKQFQLEELIIPQFQKIYQELDRNFLTQKVSSGKIHTDGACSCTLFILNNSLFFINLGDCRAIISSNKGEDIEQVTQDHKPDNLHEMHRVFSQGGELYKFIRLKSGEEQIFEAKTYQEIKSINNLEKTNKCSYGAWRIRPGGLAVSRSFGDQLSKVWNNKNQLNSLDELQIQEVVSSVPDIFEKEYKENMDFVFIASDGIFDVLSNKKITEIIWGTQDYYKGKQIPVKQVLEEAVKNVMRKALMKETDDNITIILVCFKNMFIQLFQIQQCLPIPQKTQKFFLKKDKKSIVGYWFLKTLVKISNRFF